MSPVEDFSVQPIDQRLDVLKKRQRHLMIWFILSMTTVLAVGISLFFQKEFIYRMFDLSLQVRTLDLPYHVQEMVPFENSVSYFFNLFSWLGWLLLKLFVSFFGAFLLVSLAKKFKFFRQRFQAWTQRFVTWLLAFILLWSGLSYVQYDWKDDTQQAYQQWMNYQSNIVESQIAQDLQQAEISSVERAYILAQVALLHDPVDRKTANIYMNQLIGAEKQNPVQFNNYQFNDEQLWAMQHQLYGQSLTPTTQHLDQRAQQVETMSQWLNIILWMLISVMLLVSMVLYGLANHLKKRHQRIGVKLN